MKLLPIPFWSVRKITLLVLTCSVFGAIAEPNSDAQRTLRDKRLNDSLREMEKSQVQSAGSVEVARHLDLGNKTLIVIEETLPAALKQYDDSLRGENGLLKSDAGRFLSQKPEVVETLLRFVLEERFQTKVSGPNPEEIDNTRLDFGNHERLQRAGLVRESVKTLQTLEGGAGSDFDPKTSTPALTIAANASWAASVFEQVQNRNMLVIGYQSAVPKDAKVNGLPTLEEEILATLGRRIATQEVMLNEVEKNAAQLKATKVAEVTKGFREQQLEAFIQDMKSLAEEDARLTAAKAERERQEVELRGKEQLEANKAEYDRRIEKMNQERADLDKKLAALGVELDKKQADIKALTDKVAVSTQMRALPQDAKVLIKILSAPGFYKPTSIYQTPNGSPMINMSSRYPGLVPQPHSLTALAACGALDDTVKGIMTMYCILALPDKDRPRFQSVIKLRGSSYEIYLPDDFEEAFTNSESAKSAMKKIQDIQKLVREYGDELVAAKLLAP